MSDLVKSGITGRVAAEAVRTSIHLTSRYLLTETQMASLSFALGSMLDGEYERGWRLGYDRAMKDANASNKILLKRLEGELNAALKQIQQG